MPTYATIEQVKTYTGVIPRWLDLPDVDTLDATLADWIDHAEELIQEFTRTSWAAAEVPATVSSATVRIVANIIKAARRHRQEQIMILDDLNQGGAQGRPLSPADSYLTDPIMADLKAYRIGVPDTAAASGVIPIRSPISESDSSGAAPTYFTVGFTLDEARYFPAVEPRVANKLGGD